MDWQYENGRIFSVNENKELMAETTFVYKENGEVDIDHTYVNPQLRGKGLAGELEDHATRDILIQILNDEDSHLDEIEELKDQIEHMSLPIFLTTQVG